MRRNVFVVSISALALAPLALFAWTGPTAAPPGNNVAAPINVGNVDQVKNGGLGVNALAVFGNSLFGGSTGSNAYLNFGATSGTNGYGIRDNAGTLEFKNSGGSWASLQATVFNLCSGGACGGGGAGISGLEVIYQICSGATCTASCPASKKVTGGGCALWNGNGNLQDSYGSETLWVCDYNGSINAVRAQVYCVSI